MKQKKITHNLSSASTDIAFHQAGNRPTARYISATAVCEEALERGRWIGLYWSATGYVHREKFGDASHSQSLPKRAGQRKLGA